MKTQRAGVSNVVAWAGKAYFPFHSNAEGGTVTGTRMVALPPVPGPISAHPHSLTVAPAHGVLFSAYLGIDDGREPALWNGTRFLPINLVPGPESGDHLDSFEPIVVSGSRAIFSASHANAGVELITVDLSGDSLFEWSME